MTNERLCIFLVFSNLIASKLLSSNRRMHNFIEKFTKINDICKKFAGNRVNEHGNVSRRGVIPTFSDLEVIALSLTAEAFGYDSENNLVGIVTVLVVEKYSTSPDGSDLV